ncbi:MAG TPA: hypothetical protein PKE45_04965, partial [Caldilineaceae bacterium]|nr:hypothetical protein [Caldilineaceae bacterium]
LPALVLLWRYQRQGGWGRLWRAVGWLALGSALVAGWWYLRNVLLYGSPLPFAEMAIVLPTMQRPQPMPLPQLIATIPWLFTSYWGVFVSILAPPAYLNTTTWLMLLAGAGLLAGWAMAWLSGRQRRPRPATLAQHTEGPTLNRDRAGVPVWVYVFALAWFGAIFAGVVHWTRTITFGEQGRLLHGAAPAFALLLVTGWTGWLPDAWRRWLVRLVPLLMLGIALWPLPTLQRAYALPEALTPPPTPDRPIEATFAGGMRLVGLDLPDGAALAPGERLPLTLFWQTDQEIPANYTLFVHLADEQDQLL